MADQARADRLTSFVNWCGEQISGDEKGEAQIFLDRLFQGFGQRGCLDVGGKAEFRLKKAKEDGGGTAFADYVWKPVVLVEMKKRGEDLRKHRQQAFDYWIRLVPNRPRWVVLCNFDEFWIYDFDADLAEPMDCVGLAELPERYGPLAFLFPTQEKPQFKIDRIAATEGAADLLANCYGKLKVRQDISPDTAQRFILQTLIALFSEDIGLLPKYFFAQLLDECTDPPKAFDLLDGLFRAMATREPSRGGRYKDVPYFNGGIFETPAPIELGGDEVAMLKGAAAFEWSHISPEIFGTIFQHSLDEQERHKLGGHYTTPTDIMKIIGPTIVEPWRKLIDSADSIKRLRWLHERMQQYRVLDPACGSGNFLYLAYRELKRLEHRLLERLAEVSKKADEQQRGFSFVTSKQFFGMDIVPFAVELAKVTMTLAHKLAIDELHIEEQALPLDNLDANIRCMDALIDEKGAIPAWPAADVIIGNPPFLGAKRLKPERGPDYVNAVRKLYPAVPGMADYCVYWFRRSHDHLPACTAEDPLAGRAGLVGTQNVRNNKSREGGLDHIVKSGTVVEAVDNQPWSGEANVHVSIANWVKHEATSTAADESPGAAPGDSPGAKKVRERLLIPAKKRLWFKVPPPVGGTRKRPRGQGPATKEYEIDFHECEYINSALSDETDVAGALTLACNTMPRLVFQGQVPGHEGFVLSPAEADVLIKSDLISQEIIYPYLVGRDVVTGDGKPTRFVIDFQDIDVLEASRYRAAFGRIKSLVLPDRERKAKEGKTKDGGVRPHHQLFLRYWWRHSYDRPELIRSLRGVARYIVCSRVTKRPIFNFISSAVRPDHTVFVFVFADNYSFGILQSMAHWGWFVMKCSKLTERFRYTPPSVYDTFPWPQSPSAGEVRAVAEAGREVRRVRDGALAKISGGLRAVYRTLELPGKNPLKDAHAALDTAVLKAYGFSAKKDLLKQLLDLNLEVAAKIEAGEAVTAPGVPADYPDPESLVTEDCIRAE